MTDRALIVPAAPESLDAKVMKLTRWVEGWTDDAGTPHPGLLQLVGELHAELIARRERREMFSRALASGGVLAVFGYTLTWLKDHLR